MVKILSALHTHTMTIQTEPTLKQDLASEPHGPSNMSIERPVYSFNSHVAPISIPLSETKKCNKASEETMYYSHRSCDPSENPIFGTRSSRSELEIEAFPGGGHQDPRGTYIPPQDLPKSSPLSSRHDRSSGCEEGDGRSTRLHANVPDESAFESSSDEDKSANGTEVQSRRSSALTDLFAGCKIGGRAAIRITSVKSRLSHAPPCTTSPTTAMGASPQRTTSTKAGEKISCADGNSVDDRSGKISFLEGGQAW